MASSKARLLSSEELTERFGWLDEASEEFRSMSQLLEPRGFDALLSLAPSLLPDSKTRDLPGLRGWQRFGGWLGIILGLGVSLFAVLDAAADGFKWKVSLLLFEDLAGDLGFRPLPLRRLPAFVMSISRFRWLPCVNNIIICT